MSAAIRSLKATFLALLIALGAQPDAAAAGTPKVAGGTLAGLTLIDAQGGPYAPAAANDGTVTLVGLWATWCPSCRTELPELIRIGHELQSKGVRLVLVSVDRTPEKAASYLARMNYAGRRRTTREHARRRASASTASPP